MKQPINLTVRNFGECVKEWTHEKFINTFQDVYPDADLNAISLQLNLKKAAKEGKKIEEKKESDSIS